MNLALDNTKYELFLIGTWHLDKKGPRRLKKILKFLKPDLICIEEPDISEEEIKSEKAKREKLLKQLDFMTRHTLEKARYAIEYGLHGYELATCQKNSKAPIEKIDDIEFHRKMDQRKYKNLEEIVKEVKEINENIQYFKSRKDRYNLKLAKRRKKEKLSTIKKNLRIIRELSRIPYGKLIESDQSHYIINSDSATEYVREKQVASNLYKTIKQCIKKNNSSQKSKKVVYICGFSHLNIKNNKSLASILLKTHKLDFYAIYLDEAEEFIKSKIASRASDN